MAYASPTNTLFPAPSVVGYGANNRKLQDTQLGAHDDQTKADYGTAGATNPWILCKPQASNSTRQADPPPTTGQDFGYDALQADMNVSGVNGALSTDARWLTGDRTFHLSLNNSAADVAPGAGVWQIKVMEFKRDSAGALTNLSVTAKDIPLTAGNLPVGNIAMDITVTTDISATKFEVDEVYYVEFWMKGQGLAVTGRNVALGAGTAPAVGGQATSFACSLRIAFRRSPTTETTATQPAAATVSRVLVLGRTRTETLTVAETVTRIYNGSRTVTVTTPTQPTADTITRGGSGFNRSPSAETVGPAADTVTRIYGAVRSRTEALTPSELITRVFTGARTVTETVGTAADVISRIVNFPRLITVTVGAAADTIARVFSGARTRTETVGPAADTATHTFTGARTVSESLTAADTIARAFIGARTATVPLSAAADVVTRLVTFFRTRTETLSLSDTVARVFTGARTRTETVGPAADSATRILTANRTIGEGPGDYPLNDGARAIAGIVKDEDTGAAVSGVTVYLFRTSDLQYVGRSTVTDVNGNYSFPRDTGDSNTYFTVVATDGGAPPRHGISDQALVPA
jgi:hypothetical protein